MTRAMLAAKWDPADPITLASSIRIAVIPCFAVRIPMRRSARWSCSDGSRISRLNSLLGQPASAASVRFWRWDRPYEGHEVWFGAVTFDERVGLSHTTGQVTHHIGPDVDAERDRLISQLQKAGVTERVFWLDGFQQLSGKNGGGDPWHSDGRLEAAVLATVTGPSRLQPPESTRP